MENAPYKTRGDNRSLNDVMPKVDRTARKNKPVELSSMDGDEMELTKSFEQINPEAERKEKKIKAQEKMLNTISAKAKKIFNQSLPQSMEKLDLDEVSDENLSLDQRKGLLDEQKEFFTDYGIQQLSVSQREQLFTELTEDEKSYFMQLQQEGMERELAKE